jgi:hypothetical protein
MFYDNGRLYHTVSGDSRLFYRWFTPESGVVGWDVFVAAGDGNGLNFNGAQGLTMASGRLAYSRAGVLHALDFRNGRPVPGTDAVPNSVGDWSSLGLFVLPGNSAPPAEDIRRVIGRIGRDDPGVGCVERPGRAGHERRRCHEQDKDATAQGDHTCEFEQTRREPFTTEASGEGLELFA